MTDLEKMTQFLTDLNDRRKSPTHVKHATIWEVELAGGKPISISSTIPDPNTHHDQYHYHTATNSLLMRLKVTNRDGSTEHVWKKINTN